MDPVSLADGLNMYKVKSLVWVDPLGRDCFKLSDNSDK
ncbi:hypothetical protein ABIC80_004604 [Kosakonia sp. 1610]